ncbi:TetR/AcrR family transcriptional regulator [Plantactinospora solaniradicis]|uniref:TetR/AcrR family transcriptional regulator n=1 Tax=Plantactinospora solaniradicis TaxID=1723736 RepID=A0ABW1KHA8_9ACTN
MSEADEGLRARLVAVGVAMLTSEGVSTLSLREIARRAGVSHGAPRRYFPTHLALLSAIARQGFAELSDRATEAIGTGQADPRAQLLALGRTYLDFAQSRRGMFELMFRHDLLESNQLGLRETSLPLFEALVDLVVRARPQRTGAAPRVVAGALWTNLHGIAQLWGWGSLQLATGLDEIEPLLRATLDAHLGPAHR